MSYIAASYLVLMHTPSSQPIPVYDRGTLLEKKGELFKVKSLCCDKVDSKTKKIKAEHRYHSIPLGWLSANQTVTSSYDLHKEGDVCRLNSDQVCSLYCPSSFCFNWSNVFGAIWERYTIEIVTISLAKWRCDRGLPKLQRSCLATVF